jgi:hypothetical protein
LLSKKRACEVNEGVTGESRIKTISDRLIKNCYFFLPVN